MTALHTYTLSSWSDVFSEGIATLYLAMFDEGMTTSPSDTPANVVFLSRVLNYDQFSIKRMPLMWAHGGSSGSQDAAFGQLQLDNYDGLFDKLIAADLRDAPVVLKLVPAAALLTGTAYASAMTIATGVIDSITCDNEDVVIIAFKDTIARLDKALPTKTNPPFVDQGAANVMIPLTFGACRSVQPLLVDSANRLFQLHDSNIPNVALASDKAAPLDPFASPPQYVPALNGSGLQLQAMPVGRLGVDCSSTGQQVFIPGADDVLAGSGAFPGDWKGVGGTADINTTTGAINTGTHTIPITTSGNDVDNGQWVWVHFGADSIFCQVVSGGGTATLTYTTVGQVITGTPGLIPNGTAVNVVGAPVGWKFSHVMGTTSAITKVVNPPYAILGTNNGAVLYSGRVFQPSLGFYADQLQTIGTPLLGGVSYRLTFSLYNVQAQQPYFIGGMVGGILVATKLTNNAQDYITGISQPLNTGAFGVQNFTFEFTVPPGSNRDLFFIIAPSAGNAPNTAQGTTTAMVFNVKIQRLGQYTALPLSGITFADYCTEILVNRAGEDPSIFNSAEAALVGVRSDGSVIPWGIHFDQPPNIRDTLRLPSDTFGFVVFTDALGTLRWRQLVDPSDPANNAIVKADFTPGNVQRPIAVRADAATGLTTLFGARPNWSIYGAADFVTDQAIVTQDVKTRLMRRSQFWVTSSKAPAGQYAFAVTAPIFDMLMDLAADVQTEGDRVVGIWSPQIYPDGTSTTGKRRIVTFTAFFDDPATVGVTITAAVTDIQYGDIIRFTYPTHGFNNALAVVVGWEIFPMAQKITLTVML